MSNNRVRNLTEADRPELRRLLLGDWGSTRMASRGRLMELTDLPGFIAERDGRWLGYSTYDVVDRQLEVAVLEAIVERRGAGSALLAACVAEAQRLGCGRVWLITTNDNVDALRFYQRRGFLLVALHRGAVAESRLRLKPEIPAVGANGIPIRDELELELPPDDWPAFVERHAWPS